MRRRRSDERGAAAVEMVLVAPVLIIVLSLIVATGRILATEESVVQVSREAARVAAAAPNAATARTLAYARAREVAAGLRLDPARLRIGISAGNFARGTRYVVTITYTVRLADLPGFGRLPGSFNVSSQQADLIERYKSR